jgi:phage portal protein BeeE
LLPASDAERYFVSFNVEGLLRADSKGRTEFYNSALNNGWMSRNEVRQKEDLPPIAGGDIYTVQSALIPIDKVGSNYNGGAT